MSKKVISIVLCLALVVALAVPAFAATTTLYSRTNAGYRITGTASISGGTGTSTMSATPAIANPMKPIEEYEGSIRIEAYASGKYIGSTSRNGCPDFSAVYTNTSGSLSKIVTSQRFNGTFYGSFTVSA